VEDVIDSSERGQKFLAQEAMGVGDDADEHVRDYSLSGVAALVQ
jgi:hypothetical protein